MTELEQKKIKLEIDKIELALAVLSGQIANLAVDIKKQQLSMFNFNTVGQILNLVFWFALTVYFFSLTLKG